MCGIDSCMNDDQLSWLLSHIARLEGLLRMLRMVVSLSVIGSPFLSVKSLGEKSSPVFTS